MHQDLKIKSSYIMIICNTMNNFGGTCDKHPISYAIFIFGIYKNVMFTTLVSCKNNYFISYINTLFNFKQSQHC